MATVLFCIIGSNQTEYEQQKQPVKLITVIDLMRMKISDL